MKQRDSRYRSRQGLIEMLIERMDAIGRMIRMFHEPPPLSPTHMHLLFMISMKDKGKSVKELAEMIGVTPGAVSQLVNNLVERGLIIREADPSDRRVVRLKLTELALEQMSRMKKEYFASARRVMESLSNEDLKQLVDIFQKIEVFSESRESGTRT